MVRAIRQTVRVKEEGRLEVLSNELPEGAVAEVIVLLPGAPADSRACIGLFADDPDLLDQIVEDAMKRRETPLRTGRE